MLQASLEAQFVSLLAAREEVEAWKSHRLQLVPTSILEFERDLELVVVFHRRCRSTER